MASPTTASPSDDEYLLSIRLDLSGDDEEIWNQARVYARNRLRLRVEADKRKKVPHQTRDGYCEEIALNMQDSVEPKAIMCACNLHAVAECHQPSAFNVQEVANNRTERVNVSPSSSVAGACPNAESLFDGAKRCLEPSARSQPIAGQRGLIPAEIQRHHLAEDVQEKKQHNFAAALQDHMPAPACDPSPLASPPWSEAWREDEEDTDDEEARATSEMKRDLAASRPPNEESEVVELIRCDCVPDESHCRMQQAQVSAATRHPPHLPLCSSGMLTVPGEVVDLVEELIETLELIEEDENEASAQAATQAHAGSVQAHACGAATLFVRTILSPIKEECADIYRI
jgi:hypothetical protein